MKPNLLFVCAAIGLSSIATQSAAGSLFGGNQMNGPAETPPASFREQQYVDSHGCVFLRAGDRINKVVWLPRLDNNMATKCGYRPTF